MEMTEKQIMYQKDVYKRQDMGMTYQAVLANDIRKRNHLSDLKITYVYHDQTYNLDNETKVDTLQMCIRDRLYGAGYLPERNSPHHSDRRLGEPQYSRS